MKWWIGQVTDPDKGKWGDSLEKTRAANGEDLYGLDVEFVLLDIMIVLTIFQMRICL